jgi:holliday junction DNA helicase RuvA
MIAYIKGKILNKRKNYLIVDVRDIGYQIYVNPTLFAEVMTGQPIELYLHQYIKEDALDLYGFKSLEELEMFELLISISGVGPKSALGIMGIANADVLSSSIARGDSSLLTKVSGIGRKIAERIVLELRDKIATLSFEHTAEGTQASMSVQSDELDALIALGYSLQQSRDALRQVDPSIVKSGERIREALKMLGKS